MSFRKIGGFVALSLAGGFALATLLSVTRDSIPGCTVNFFRCQPQDGPLLALLYVAPALLVLFRGRYLLDFLRGLLGIAKSKADAIAEQGRK